MQRVPAPPFTPRALRIATGALLLLLNACTVVGYQALLPVLKASGVYNYLCTAAEQTTSCTAQDLALGRMFNLSVSFLNGFALPWSQLQTLLAAKLGIDAASMICSGLGSTFLVGGALMFAFSSADMPLYKVGYCSIAIAAGGLVFPVMGLNNDPGALFPPGARARVQSVFAGAIDGCCAVFLLLAFIYYETGATLRQLFVWFAAVSAAAGAAALLAFRGRAKLAEHVTDYHEQERERAEAADRHLEGMAASETLDSPHAPLLVRDPGAERRRREHVRLHGTFAAGEGDWARFKSVKFMALIAWMSTYMVDKYFLVLNWDSILAWASDDAEFGRHGALVYSIVAPASFLFGPFTGWFTDRYGLPVAVTFLSLCTIALGITACVSNHAVLYASIVLLAFTRFYFFLLAPLVIGSVFGGQHFMNVYGAGLLVASLFNLLGGPLTHEVQVHMNGDFETAIVATTAMTAVSGLLFAACLHRWLQ